MSDRDEALKLIKDLEEDFSGGDYIFRGTRARHSENYDGVNSTLYRWALIGGKGNNLTQKSFSPSESPADIELEIVRRAKHLYPSNTKPDEILTDLQHFGGNTNMIDFSRNMYIALFFACQDKRNEDGELVCGELIALHTSKAKKIDEIDYSISPKERELEIIDPANTKDSRQRVSFQSSVFVRPASGYIDRELYDFKKIEAYLKGHIRHYLKTLHNITMDTVYNDIHGFIKKENNSETSPLYFHTKLASLNEHNYEEAVLYYGKFISQNPHEPTAYYGLGAAYYNWAESCLGCREKYELAVKSFSEAISHNHKYARAYFARGVTYAKLGQSILSIEDLKQATILYPDHTIARAEAYYELGRAKIQNGNEAEGEADIAKSEEMGFSPYGD